MEIRVMTIEDYDEVYSLWKRTPNIGLVKADSREGIDAFLKRNPGLSFVATQSGSIIGTILSGHDGRKGYIFHAAVEKEHQGHGIGKELVKRVKDGLMREGITRLALFVYKKNDKGNEFWQKSGWELRSDLNYYVHDINS